jgi:hypothetical protein
MPEILANVDVAIHKCALKRCQIQEVRLGSSLLAWLLCCGPVVATVVRCLNDHILIVYERLRLQSAR